MVMVVVMVVVEAKAKGSIGNAGQERANLPKEAKPSCRQWVATERALQPGAPLPRSLCKTTVS